MPQAIGIDLFAVMKQLAEEANAKLQTYHDILKDEHSSEGMKMAAALEGSEYTGGLKMLDKMARKLQEIGEDESSPKMELSDDQLVNLNMQEEGESTVEISTGSNVVDFTSRTKH